MSRFKKIIVSAIAGMVFFATVNVNALAQASTDTKSQPSHWAEEEISEAIAKGLVPEELQTNYQSNIKRYEYVLLALKVFDKTGKQVNTENEKPFNDVLNHKYEQEIVRAYNAGIIKGDGKGNFFPDNYITRQEIASLVVNLLMRISPEKDFSVKNSYEYSDESEISDWAKYYIDYCFENKILTGYGNNVIDPKGNATIEQSIALLYRLAKNEGLIDEQAEESEKVEGIRGPVKIEELSQERIEAFVGEYNAETFDIIKKTAENENVEITSFWDKSATLLVKENTISLNSPDFEKNIFALVHDINDELFLETFKKLIKANFINGEKGVTLLEQHLNEMKGGELVDVYEEISENERFVIESLKDDVDNSVSYLMAFIQKKMK